jgi:hypothetical protein
LFVNKKKQHAFEENLSKEDQKPLETLFSDEQRLQTIESTAQPLIDESDKITALKFYDKRQ